MMAKSNSEGGDEMFCKAFGIHKVTSRTSLVDGEQREVSCAFRASRKSDEFTTEAILTQMGVDQHIVSKVMDIKHGFKHIRVLTADEISTSQYIKETH